MIQQQMSQRFAADFSRQHSQMINNQMMMNMQRSAMISSYRAELMKQFVGSTYRKLTKADVTPLPTEDEPYLAKDLIERAQQIRTISVLPPEISSFLFTKEGYFLQPLLDSITQRLISQKVFDQLTLQLAKVLGQNKRPIRTHPSDYTLHQLKNLGFAQWAVADTTLDVLLSSLGVDMLLVPRVTVFGIGTKHVDDAIEAGVKPDSSFRINLTEKLQGVFFSVEVVAYDRQSFTSDPKRICGFWRSQPMVEAPVFIAPFNPLFPTIIVKHRAVQRDYLSASKTLSNYTAFRAPLRDEAIKKLISQRQRETKTD